MTLLTATGIGGILHHHRKGLQRPGTPSGVGAFMTPPIWLKHNDVVEVEIEEIGLIRNKLKVEA
jgi:hypothetical protein